MPSIDHESLVELFRNRPVLAAELLRDGLGIELPAFDDAATDSIDHTQITPAEYRSDAVAILKAAGKPVLALIVEVQLSEDTDKLYSWPVYTTDLRSRLRCDAGALVITDKAFLARWAARPIPIGLGNSFQPLVIGPRGVPPITDLDQARQAPELAVFSAVSYGDHEDVKLAVQVALTAAKATETLPNDQQTLYLDMILAALSAAARKAFEMLPQGYQFQSDVGRDGQLKGLLRGKAEAVIDALEVRELPITDEQRERIMSCTDLDTLRRWHRKAITAASTTELFADDTE